MNDLTSADARLPRTLVLSLLLAMACLIPSVRAQEFQVGDRVTVKQGQQEFEGIVKAKRTDHVYDVEHLGGPFKGRTVPTFTRFMERQGGSSKPAVNPFQAAGKPQFREWTDATGQFKIEALFVRLQGDQVTIQRRDGQEITLPLEKLSAADQQYARAQGGPPPLGEIAIVSPDLSAVQRLAPGRAPNPSGFQPDAAAAVAGSFNPIVLRGKAGRFFENPNGLSLLPDRAQALIAYVHAPPGKPKSTRFEFCDLQAGTAVAGPEVAEELKTFGRSPDGSLLLTRNTKFGFGESSRVDVWKVDGVACQRIKSWIPYEAADKTKRNVAWAAWVDAGHFLTFSAGGVLTLWDASAARAIYELETGRAQNLPSLSANRRHVGLVSESGVEVLDALRGDVLLRCSPEASHSAAVAFRQDGGGLAVLTSGRMQLWDLPSGTKLDDVSVPGVTSPQRVDWLDDEYALANCQYLVAVGRHCVIWDYGAGTAKPDCSENAMNRFWYVATEGDRQSLVPVQLPHAAAINAAQGIQDRDFAVSPGMQVGLEVRVPVDVEPLNKIQSALQTKLEQSGFAVASGGSVKLVARTEQGEQETRSYRSFGSIGTQEVTVRAVINLLEFVVGGKTVWQRRAVTSAPHMLHMEDGESVQQAVKRAVQPNVGFFTGEWVPTFIPRPELAQNQSRLTIAGVR